LACGDACAHLFDDSAGLMAEHRGLRVREESVGEVRVGAAGTRPLTQPSWVYLTGREEVAGTAAAMGALFAASLWPPRRYPNGRKRLRRAPENGFGRAWFWSCRD
jgi:hypothetical protein